MGYQGVHTVFTKWTIPPRGYEFAVSLSLAFVGDLEMIGPRLDIHRFQFGHGHCANKEKCCGTPN